MNEESIVPVLRGPSEPHQISSHEPLVLEVVKLLHVLDRLNLEPVKKPKLVVAEAVEGNPISNTITIVFVELSTQRF